MSTSFTSMLLLLSAALCLSLHFALGALNEQSKWKEISNKKSEMDFMQKLFDRFNRAGDSEWPNTAVGYTPSIQVKHCDGQPEKFGLEFRLNELKQGERLIRAELHLFFPQHFRTMAPIDLPAKHRKLHGKTKIPPKHIELFHASTCERSAEKWQLGRSNDSAVQMLEGWATFNALGLVENFLTSGQQQNRLFLQFQKHGRELSSSQLDRLLHLHRPFLVVYTDNDLETEEKTLPFFRHMKRAKRDIRATVTNYEDEEAVRRHMEATRKTAEYYSYGMARSGPADRGMPIDGNSKGVKTWGKGPAAMLNRRRQKSGKGRRKSVRSYPGFDPNDPMLGFGTRFSPWDRQRRLLQSPNLGNSLNDIRTLRENSYKVEEEKSKGKHGAEEEKPDTKVVLLGREDDDGEEERRQKDQKKCTRHNLTVDFREIGWADRIIAPRRFEAGYCAGSCDYPLEQEQNPSNHAILQALIYQQRKNGQPNGPPPVCCAPEKFDSLTLLYFDERDNVVLKNYPRISVLECGCI